MYKLSTNLIDLLNLHNNPQVEYILRPTAHWRDKQATFKLATAYLGIRPQVVYS